ncbi:MAG: hypothetical protein KAJ18_02550 [Candidatus Omnitrophica bacterium]|nr:hypothetical protein [Candidatus Omnitrophota bacterium]
MREPGNEKQLIFPRFLRKSSPVFKHFLQLDEVFYCGLLNNKIIAFDTGKQSQAGKVFMASIIREEEAELWNSFQGLIANIFASVEPKLHGFFCFELLSVEMSEEFDSFQWNEFSAGITDLARQINAGESKFVQYCSLLGVLTKHAYEDYGKISFSPHVKVVDNNPEELNVSLEPLIKENQRSESLRGTHQLIFYDLSRRPLYNAQNKSQAEQLQKISRKLEHNSRTTITEVYIVDKDGLHPLFQKSQLELELFYSTGISKTVCKIPARP